LTGTLAAPLSGSVEVTVGALPFVVGPVVKLHTKSAASALPWALCAAVVTLAVNWVFAARATFGARTAVLLVASYVTVPGTRAPPPVTAIVKVPVAMMVAGFICALKVAEIFWLSGTLVARFGGLVKVTSGRDEVVKVHTKFAASGAPVGSCAPVVIVAVNNVLVASVVAGVKVAVVPAKVTIPATGVAPGPVNVNVDALIEAGFIASLNVAETVVSTATPVAPFTGIVEMTVGGGAVVKVHTKFAASAAPVGSFAPVVIVAMYKVPVARMVVGVNVAVVPAKVTVPTTGVAPGPAKVNVLELMVAAFMASLKVAETGVLTGTTVDPLTGTVEMTVGGEAVVKVQTKLAASGTPVRFFAPVVIVAVNKVPVARIVVGVNVAVVPANVTVPATGVVPGPVKVNVAALIVAGFIAWLNVAETVVLTATPIAPFAGTVETTVAGGAVVKVHTKLAASVAPVGFFAPVVMVAVNTVLVASEVVGVKVAVVPTEVTVPATGVAPGPVKVKVAALIVAGFITSLKVAEIVVLTATAVAPLTGTVETTVGAGAVVKTHEKLAANGWPARS
jgi:hypothetical protein